ncbi:hypothetical protein FXO38_04914 [Capsicum annuum]|nr:hypothetical protein FXO38_04914 [Capsicum annuum]KAF3677657.1 hypothetical protein FXO37_04728 [Capsicum annuum]
MFFYLTTLCLQRFTSEDTSEVLEGTSDKEHFMIVEAWKHSDFLCRNYILSGLQDDLYNVYSLIVNVAFQVVAIIEKIPPIWKDFKNYLKHKFKEMTIKDLIVRLRIEEDNKATERSNQPKKKFKGKCFNYDKIGHKSTDCRSPKKGKKKDKANMVESNEKCDDLCAMFLECNLVGNLREWWIDSGATRHVCANKELFSSFAPAQTCIARSTMESEFITLDKAGEEAEWLQNFLEDIPYWPKPVAPVCIHCDSQAAISRGESMMYNDKSHYIRWRYNTIRKLLSSGIITVDYVNSKDNMLDPLTKGLSREGVERISKGMGLRPRTSQHGGNST